MSLKQRKRGYEIAAVNISGGINTRKKKSYSEVLEKKKGQTVVKKLFVLKWSSMIILKKLYYVAT